MATFCLLSVVRKNFFLKRLFSSRVKVTYDNKSSSENPEDVPIKYSTSKAAAWTAEQSFSGNQGPDITPSYQPLVVAISLAAFLLYFGVLREESDIDEGLYTSLYDRVDGLEELQIKSSINYYKQNEPNFDSSVLEKRLADLRSKRTPKND